jgi:polyisoprenyl-phosphate glycosyltransferase
VEERARKKISIIVPAFNEAENIATVYQRVSEVFVSLKDQYDVEIIFTDNHSDDGTFEIISSLAQADRRVRGVRFARNFGFNRSVLTGYRLARGDAAIQMDCDLQDPPEVLPEFLRQWEAGHDLVVGVRKTREDGQGLQWARSLFYRLLQRLSDDNIVVDSGDFRLLDRTILEQLHWVDDAVPYVRGLTSLLARNQGTVLYDRRPRAAGESKFPLRRLLNLAIDGLLAHSTVPLRFASYTGFVISVLTFVLSLIYVIGRVFFSADWPAGFATTTVLLLLGVSLNAIFLGIIGEYVGRIYNQVRKRPSAVIERSVNMSPAEGLTQPSWPAPLHNGAVIPQVGRTG